MVRVCCLDRNIRVRTLTPTKTLGSEVSAYNLNTRKEEAGQSLGLGWPDILVEFANFRFIEILRKVI